MKASISEEGILFIEAENELESYALHKWADENESALCETEEDDFAFCVKWGLDTEL